MPNFERIRYETRERVVSQSITFFRCWSSDHRLSFLKRVVCNFRNSRRRASEARGNSSGRSALYDFKNSEKERVFSLRMRSTSGNFIDPTIPRTIRKINPPGLRLSADSTALFIQGRAGCGTDVPHSFQSACCLEFLNAC